MILKELIKDIIVSSVSGDTGMYISALTFDSRNISPDCLFAAVRGTASDGHHYISQAIQDGARAIICEKIPEVKESEVCYIEVKNSRSAISFIASAWYGHPSRELKLVGITGTNGKTTIATLLYKVNTGLGYKAGILSTIEILICGESFPATHTTPDALQVNMWLRKMVDAGCSYCFMEVSSHAVSQHRIDGLQFDAGIFTNITHDHLDYHKDFKSYLEAKKKFFDDLPLNSFALTNANDKNGEIMLQNCNGSKYRYSLGRMSDFKGKIIEQHFEGMNMQINGKEVWLRLTGKFNALNILAVYGACVLLGHKGDKVLRVLSDVSAVEGRFEIHKGPNGGIAIIDYAHTDDALKNVLETIREVNSDKRELITVVGAGGDRDKSKRPKMGAVAAALSDKVILTSDNPRSEKAETIMMEMENGVPVERLGIILKITNREEAIKTACLLGGNHSIILIAGKGHEKYQIINGEKYHFDDKEILIKYLM